MSAKSCRRRYRELEGSAPGGVNEGDQRHSNIVAPSAVPKGSACFDMGSSIMKVAPWPGREVTTILPPCSRTIFCETGKPRPVPREPLLEAKI